MIRAESASLFRERLNSLIERSGMSRSAFASHMGLDRSTLSQLLTSDEARLPRVETILSIATACQVSLDWLLGLSHSRQPDSQLVLSAPEIERGAVSSMEARLRQWHADAVGYKIRYVPATVPDLLKTPELIHYESRAIDAPEPSVKIEESEERLAYSRRTETDMEVCCDRQRLEAFAAGEGIWSGLSATVRQRQLQHMVTLVEELYPTFRWFLYDGLQRFSVPYTIFGPQRAAVYFGNMYFVFSATEQIRVLTRHFDDLIRASIVQPTEVQGLLVSLLDS